MLCSVARRPRRNAFPPFFLSLRLMLAHPPWTLSFYADCIPVFILRVSLSLDQVSRICTRLLCLLETEVWWKHEVRLVLLFTDEIYKKYFFDESKKYHVSIDFFEYNFKHWCQTTMFNSINNSFKQIWPHCLYFLGKASSLRNTRIFTSRGEKNENRRTCNCARKLPLNFGLLELLRQPCGNANNLN